MKTTNVLIVGGGKSSEHEVSLVSAAAIARAIDKNTYRVYLAGITQHNEWFLQGDDELRRLCADKTTSLRISRDTPLLVSPPDGFRTADGVLPIDVVFPALHGTGGEDGVIQGLLENLNSVAYVGNGVMASAIAMDKEKTKLCWQALGLPVVPGICLKRADYESPARLEQSLAYALQSLGVPLFVKPACVGSSVGASRVADAAELRSAIAAAFEWDHKVLIEKAIPAREIECALLGESVFSGEIRLCGFGEIVPHHTFYDYNAKYHDPDGAELIFEPELSDGERQNLSDIAVKAYRALDCAGLARLDFFIDKDDGAVYLNEINTMPGFTPISMYPALCERAGISYSSLIDRLIAQAIARVTHNARLQRDFSTLIEH